MPLDWPIIISQLPNRMQRMPKIKLHAPNKKLNGCASLISSNRCCRISRSSVRPFSLARRTPMRRLLDSWTLKQPHLQRRRFCPNLLQQFQPRICLLALIRSIVHYPTGPQSLSMWTCECSKQTPRQVRSCAPICRSPRLMSKRPTPNCCTE